jgi:hypothetical protein
MDFVELKGLEEITEPKETHIQFIYNTNQLVALKVVYNENSYETYEMIPYNGYFIRKDTFVDEVYKDNNLRYVYYMPSKKVIVDIVSSQKQVWLYQLVVIEGNKVNSYFFHNEGIKWEGMASIDKLLTFEILSKASVKSNWIFEKKENRYFVKKNNIHSFNGSAHLDTFPPSEEGESLFWWFCGGFRYF